LNQTHIYPHRTRLTTSHLPSRLVLVPAHRARTRTALNSTLVSNSNPARPVRESRTDTSFGPPSTSIPSQPPSSCHFAPSTSFLLAFWSQHRVSSRRYHFGLPPREGRSRKAELGGAWESHRSGAARRTPIWLRQWNRWNSCSPFPPSLFFSQFGFAYYRSTPSSQPTPHATGNGPLLRCFQKTRLRQKQIHLIRTKLIPIRRHHGSRSKCRPEFTSPSPLPPAAPALRAQKLGGTPSAPIRRIRRYLAARLPGARARRKVKGRARRGGLYGKDFVRTAGAGRSVPFPRSRRGSCFVMEVS
jgi:hypothetical protein